MKLQTAKHQEDMTTVQLYPQMKGVSLCNGFHEMHVGGGLTVMDHVTIMTVPCELHHRWDLSYPCLQESTHTGIFMVTCCITSRVGTFMLQLLRRMRASLIILIGKPTETYTDPLKQPHPLLSNRPSIQERSLSVQTGWSAAALSVSQWAAVKSNQFVKSLIKLNTICSIHAAPAHRPAIHRALVPHCVI